MSRCYEIEGAEYPSVTTILALLDKPFLLPWAAEQGAKYVLDHIREHGPDVTILNRDPVISEARVAHTKLSGAAKDIGSDVHHLLEVYIKYKINGADQTVSLKDYCEEVLNCFAQFQAWESKYNPLWLKSEHTVINAIDGFAGTLDAVCEIDGKIYVIDFKTDKQISDTYPLQISAYQSAYNLSGGKANSQAILRLPKDGGAFEWVDYSEDYNRALMAFKGLVQYYYFAKKRRLKNNPKIEMIWSKK